MPGACASSGLVKNPVELFYGEIRARAPVHEMLTLECISNSPNGDAISNANWTGVRLAPILERAGIRTNAVYAAMRAADGYYTGVPLEEIRRPENFLRYLMNGVPLPPVHGFPLRIFIPGKYGMKQPKWLTEIKFVDHEFVGYWEARGWSNSAWRKVNSGFFSPRLPGSFFDIFSRSVPAKAPVDIVGWALAGPAVSAASRSRPTAAKPGTTPVWYLTAPPISGRFGNTISLPPRRENTRCAGNLRRRRNSTDQRPANRQRHERPAQHDTGESPQFEWFS
jgi:hypothetical protein